MAVNELEVQVIDTHRPFSLTYNIHPEGEAAFRAVATPKDVIRKGRSHIPGGCSSCAKVAHNGQELKRCSKGKMVWYCSEDCQKTDWPIHKPICKENSSNIHKLLTSFMANPLLVYYLQVAFVIQFNLTDDAQAAKFIDKPFIARCQVRIDPVDMVFMFMLRMDRFSKEQLEKGTEGMLQLKTFVPLDMDQDGKGAGDALRMEIWKDAKRKAAANGLPHAPIGLVEFVLWGREQGMPFAVGISEDSVNRVLSGEGFEYASAVFDGPTKVELDVEACLEVISMHIRADKKNQLRLRTHLNKKDIDKL